jgi:Flp pilus assembly protein TadG
VEFALVLPVMALLLLIAVDFGRLFFTYIEVQNSAREAAFAAAADLDNTTAIQKRATAEVNVQGQGGEGSIVVSTPTCMAAVSSPAPAPTACPSQADDAYVAGAGHQVSVTVTRSFTFLSPLIKVFFPTFTVGATGVAPVVVDTGTTSSGPGPTPDPCAAVADFTFDQSAWNKAVDFDGTGSTPSSPSCTSDHVTVWAWDFGDGNNGSGSTVSHKFKDKDRQYTVTLTVTTKSGATATFSQPVLTLAK